jgi:hypothetical protein
MWAIRCKDSKHDGRTFSLEIRYRPVLQRLNRRARFLVGRIVEDKLSFFFSRENDLPSQSMGGVLCYLISTGAVHLRLHMS